MPVFLSVLSARQAMQPRFLSQKRGKYYKEQQLSCRSTSECWALSTPSELAKVVSRLPSITLGAITHADSDVTINGEQFSDGWVDCHSRWYHQVAGLLGSVTSARFTEQRHIQFFHSRGLAYLYRRTVPLRKLLPKVKAKKRKASCWWKDKLATRLKVEVLLLGYLSEECVQKHVRPLKQA